MKEDSEINENESENEIMNTSLENLELIKETPRENNIIYEVEKIHYVIQEYIVNNNLYLKDTYPPVLLKLKAISEDNMLTLLVQEESGLSDEFTLFLTLKKHMELVCQKIEDAGDGVIRAQIKELHIAGRARASRRVDVLSFNVFAHNFLISKNKIDLNPFSYSISNQVIFNDSERVLQKEHPFLKILDMDPQNSSVEKSILKKHKKGFLVTNLQEKPVCESGDDLLDIKEVLKDDFSGTIRSLVDRGVKSWMVRPILYTNVGGEVFPIGYFLMKSTDRPYTLEDYNNFAEEEKKIIERITDANTILIKEKEQVLNISGDGMLLMVKNNELKDLIQQRTNLTFDLLFRFQAGLRFYANVNHIFVNDDGDLLVGLAFTGVVYSGVRDPRSKKILMDTLGYLVKQGAPLME